MVIHILTAHITDTSLF